MMDAKLYFIHNIGCDDSTIGIAYLTDEEFELFKAVIGNLNRNSSCICMPRIEVYEITEEDIEEVDQASGLVSARDILWLGKKAYTLKDSYNYWSQKSII